MKALKITGIVIGIVILLLIIVPFFIPAETYKKLIVSQAEKQLSAKIEVASMRLRILPWPGFILKDIKITNSSGTFEGEKVVAAGKIAADVRLRPLLRKIVVASLELIKPEVYYRTAGDKHTNIDDLLKKPDLKNQPNQEIPEKQEETKPETTSSIFLGSGILINEAWAEEKAKTAPTASAWQVMIGGFEIEDALLQMWDAGKDKPTQEVKHLTLSLDKFSPTAKEAKTNFKLSAAVMGQEKQNVHVKGGVTLRMEAKEADLNNWIITMGQANFNLNAKTKYGLTPPHIDANLSGNSVTLDQLLAFDPTQKKNLPQGVIWDGPISLDVGIKGTPNNANISVKVDGTQAKLGMDKTFVKDSGNAMKVELSGNYSQASISINPLSMTLGNTVLNIVGDIANNESKNGGLKIDSAAVRLDEIAKMMPALVTLSGVASPKVHIEVDGPFSDPTQLNVKGSIGSQKVSYTGYELTNLNTNFSYAKPNAKLDSLTAELYEGKLDGTASVVLADEPSYTANVGMNSVNLALIPSIEGLIIGKGAVKIDIQGKGADPELAKKSLNGTGFINLKDGEIPKLDLGKKIFGNSAWQKLGGLAGFSGTALSSLTMIDSKIKDLNINFKIENGVINTPDINWQHPQYRISASGTIDLDQNMNYKGEFALSKQQTDLLIGNATAKNILANNRGELTIPFTVTGNVASPDVSPDESYLVTLFEKAIKEAIAKKAVEAIQQKLLPQGTQGGATKPPSIQEDAKKLKKILGF